jgi:processive 1,2-diacylglycerol beta-glucosyltransferase
MSKRILFLYISTSSGHQRAADAVREALSLLAPSWWTHGVDSFSNAFPTIGKLISKTYLEVLRRTPAIWDYIYDNPDVEAATREVREVLQVLSSPKTKSLIKKHSPDALVCTQAVPCFVYSMQKRRGKLNLPIIAVVTDFAIHSYWIYKEVDLYCVPSEDVRKDLIRRGINASRIAVTGIPISPRFWRRTPKEAARQQLQLDPHRPTILVMGGSQGLGPMQETVKQIHHVPAQIIITTGLNRDLFRSLTKQYGKDRRVRVFGYTTLVNTMMDAADLLLTKPGGLTSSEALAKGVPMIITNPIPGQEERNANFLLRRGAAERADEPAQIAAAVESLIQHPARLRRMEEKIREIAKPYSSMDIARHIFRIVGGAPEADLPSILGRERRI